MRTKREKTYGMPARTLANANCGRIVQDANDCNDCQTAAIGTDPRPNGTNRLPNAPCTYVRRGSPMPGADASRLTSSRGVLDRTRFSRELAENIAALRSAAEQSLAVLP